MPISIAKTPHASQGHKPRLESGHSQRCPKAIKARRSGPEDIFYFYFINLNEMIGQAG